MGDTQILKTIAENTKPKTGFDMTLSDRSTKLSCSFSPELNLQGNWGLALQNIATYNSIANVDNKNNKFKYFNGKAWETLSIGTGSYEIKELSDEIVRLMKLNEDYDEANDIPNLYFEANLSRLTTEIYLKNGYKVDFNIVNGLATTLGFGKVILDKPYNESTEPINIITINSILVHCDLVQSSYFNGKPSNIIHSFPINTSPGFRMVSEPLVQRYHRILARQVGTMTVWLTDDSGNLLNLRNELVTVNLRFK